jgi:hypothetical protein
MTATTDSRRAGWVDLARRYPLPVLTAILAIALAAAIALQPAAFGRAPAGSTPVVQDLGPITRVASSVPALPARYRVTGISQFSQIRGQASWVPNARTRVARSVWVFNKNGSFSFNTVDVRSDLYPLVGRFTVRGSTISFAATRRSTIGASSNVADISGTVDFSGRVPVLRFTWSSGAVSAAVVNNQQFGSNTLSAYKATVTLGRF